MEISWLSLVPPILVVTTALIIKNINLSLFLGILSASLIVTDWSITTAGALLAGHAKTQFMDIEKLYLYAFLIATAVLITLFNRTGCITSFSQLVTRHIKNARTIQISSIIVSFLLFIDDYLSILTVGFIMTPLADRFAIARHKLAYLVHTLAGPLVILAPISSWVGAITTYISDAGIQPLYQAATAGKLGVETIAAGAHVAGTAQSGIQIIADPFFIYLGTIPFIFYSFLTVGSALFIVYSNISYGPMGDFENLARSHKKSDSASPVHHAGPRAPDAPEIGSEPLSTLHTGWLSSDSSGVELSTQNPGTNHNSHHASDSQALDLFIPIAALILSTFVGILYMGNYHLLGGTLGFMDAIRQSTDLNLVLLLSSIFSLLLAIALSWARGTLSFRSLPSITHEGAQLMYSVIVMLFLASIFGAMLKNDLHTGNYLATTLLMNLPLFLFPVLFFIVSTIITIATGGAWATIALMLPIAVPMITTLTSNQAIPIDAAQIPILLPLMGAIFSGAVCGDHLSPICGATIMTSSSTGVDPIEHAHTQFFYALPAVLATLLAFVISGALVHYPLWINSLASLSMSFCACFGMLLFLNKKMGNKKA
jgi:tetracycline resistance efflux pump